jgi:hypothetical protein
MVVADATGVLSTQSVPTGTITGTGTTNYLSKWTSSSSLNNSLVYDDGTNIGIGTTTPSYKLDVNGTGRVQTSFTIGGASDGTLYFPNTTSGHQIRIYSQFASNALVLYANGYNLQLNGAGGMTTNLCTTITGSNGSTALVVQQGNAAWTPVAKFNAIGSTGTQFNTNGNVLIGTTTDAGFKLDVNGTARIQNTLNMGTSTDFQISGTSVVNKGISRLVGNGNGLIFSENMQAAQIAFQFVGNGSTTGNSKAFLSTGGKSVFNINVGLGNPNTSNCDASVLLLDGIHNITSFTNTIIRGIYYNPTLTSLTGVISHRAIQTTTGDVLLGTTSGSVGIGVNTSINASAILDITSTTQGFLKPRMTTTQRNAIATPATGLEVYNTTTNTEDYYNGTAWVSLQTSAAAVKSFGAWQTNATQTAAANNTGYGVRFDTADISGQGIAIQADLLGNNTLIKMANAGYYNIQFSFQFQNIDNQLHDVSIWLRKNGQNTAADVAGSGGFVSVPNSHGGTPGHCIVAWNYFVQANANDYFQLVWSTNSAANVTMEFYPAGSPPPSSASAILTVNQVN